MINKSKTLWKLKNCAIFIRYFFKQHYIEIKIPTYVL